MQVDTTNILFICGGAFGGLEKVIQNRTDRSGMGFGAHVRSTNNREELNELLHDVEPEDLIKYGLIPEFVGRLPVVAVLDELDTGRAREDPHRAQERADQAVPEAARHGRRRARVPRPRPASHRQAGARAAHRRARPALHHRARAARHHVRPAIPRQRPESGRRRRLRFRATPSRCSSTRTSQRSRVASSRPPAPAPRSLRGACGCPPPQSPSTIRSQPQERP